jgi:hypothetical protein
MCPSCGRSLSRPGDTVDVLGTGRPQGTTPEFLVFVRNVIRQIEGLKTQLKELLDHR